MPDAESNALEKVNTAKRSKESEEKLLETMRSRLEMAATAYNTSREDEVNDLKFKAGSSDNKFQWPDDVLATRGSVQGQNINARPCLTINKLPQHVHQITNEIRQNRPAGKVVPVNDKGDVEVAEIYEGLVRHIEYISDADIAYDTAAENQVTYGEGYWRILTEYVDDISDDQEIKIVRIRNSFSTFGDPMAQDPCGADCKWYFITHDLTKEDYEEQYPDAADFGSLKADCVGNESLARWLGKDTVRIAEYFYIETTKATLNIYHNKASAIKGSKEDKIFIKQGLQPIKTRDIDKKQVKWLKTNGREILDEKDWAGKWIPIVRVIGNEYEIEGELHYSGIVRNAKDAQRMYNYWTSQEAEMLALAPKAPFIGYIGQFEGVEDKWASANTTAWPYLEVNPDVTDGNGSVLPLPQRSQPPMAQAGLQQAKLGASDDIKATTGQYDSSLGQQSNERTGKAILAREKQSDVGTFHYGDNLKRAVRFSTRQLIDLIPKIYDTERIVRIVGLDGETKMAETNPDQPEPVKKIVNPDTGIVLKKVYNLGVGTYDVCSVTGPGYMTKRQEALDAMGQLLQGNPQLWAVAGDLFIKNMDWPGSREMAARFAKSIDPKLLSDDEKSPELQAAEKKIQEDQQLIQQMHGLLQNVEKSIEVQGLKIKEYEAQIKAFDAETKRITAVQASMSPEQIQDIVLGTVHGMITSGDLVGDMPGHAPMAQEQGGAPPPPPAGPPDQGVSQEPPPPPQQMQGSPS